MLMKHGGCNKLSNDVFGLILADSSGGQATKQLKLVHGL
jgi:hypothetical protein